MLPVNARAGVPTIVSVLVSAETMESAMAHHGASRPPRKYSRRPFSPVRKRAPNHVIPTR